MLGLVVAVGSSLPAQTLSLREVVQRALERRPLMQQARAQTRVGEEEVNLAWSRYYPSAQLELIAKEGPAAAPNLFTLGLVNSILTRNVGSSLVVQQTLLDSGTRHHHLEAQQFELRRLQSEERLVASRLVLEVTRAYIRLWAAQERLQLCLADLEARRSLWSQAELRLKKGLISRVEATQAESLVNEAEALAAQTDTELRQARVELQRVQGLPPGPGGSVLAPTWAPPGREEKPDWSQRPELQVLELAEKARERDALSAEQELGPSLKGLATVGYLNVAPENQGVNHTYAVGLALTFPFADGGASQARGQIRRHQAEALRAAREEMQLALQSELERSLGALDLQRRLDKLRASQLQLATYQSESTRLRFKHGLVSMLEVVQAQLARSNAEQSLLRTRVALLTAEAELHFAQGHPWPW